MSNLWLIEHRTPVRYITSVIKRLLFALFFAWIAIAPAIASSCAAGCETGPVPMQDVVHDHEVADASGLPYCQGNTDEPDDSGLPDGSSMVIACFVAGAVSLPPLSISVVKVGLTSEQGSVVLLPPHSFHTSAPSKPPQA